LILVNSRGQELDTAQWQPGRGDLTLHTFDAKSVYLFDDNCVIQLRA
jgi:hypothetical protein